MAAAVQQGQAGLDERTGGLVQCFISFAGVAPAQLRLPQDQIHQTDQLVTGQLQDKLLGAFLEEERCLLLIISMKMHLASSCQVGSEAGRLAGSIGANQNKSRN